MQDITKYIREDPDPLSAQEKVLKVTALHYLNEKCPIKEGYQQVFLKTLISEVSCSL